MAIVLFRGRWRAAMSALCVLTPAGLLAIELARPAWIGAMSGDARARLVYVGATTGGALVVLGILSAVIVRAYRETTDALRVEQRRSQELLDNVLPPSVSERLKARPGVIADAFDDVTVLFTDFVGFTSRSAQMRPEAVVALLDEIFSRFDEICGRHGLEKVATIGDAYMAVAGIPRRAPITPGSPRAWPSSWSPPSPDGIALRVGLHSGPVVAGVIGRNKFIYDLWGDTVNTASRMESHGEPGRIQITADTRARLGEAFSTTARGAIAVKGKGSMETYFLEGEASPEQAAR